MISPNLPGLKNQSFLRGAAIYGPNASGKSNLVLSLWQLQNLVRTSHTFESGEPLDQEPFRFETESASSATCYEVRFVMYGVRYHFRLAFNRERVLEENLSAFPHGKEQVWYERTWDENSAQYHYYSPETESFTIRKAEQEATKANSLFLSVATNLFDHPKLGKPYRWFRESLKILNPSIFRGEISDISTLQRLVRDPELALAMLRQADLGILDVEIRKEKISEDLIKLFPKDFMSMIPEGQIDRITMVHQGQDGRVYPLEFEKESAGTQRYFKLIGPWLSLIESGGVLFLDEIEASLHPLLTRKLVETVMNPEINTKNAQIIFTTHDPTLLDLSLLRRDQIWLVEKSQANDSILYPVTEYKMTTREDLAKGYLSGKYGAVPFLPASLIQNLESD
ncbi:MAG: ATP-binding protein [Kiritimatiellae bacterium]|nr:ATP-binding protein [Kiritimatiellia bacterium]